MTSPLIWVFIPGLASLILVSFRRWQKGTAAAGAALSLGLAWLAWNTQFGVILSVGPWRLRIDDTMLILGRRFVLEDSDRPTLALVYLAAGFWFGGAYVSRSERLFTPLGLGIVALMTAALAVQPFLYAALLIELAVLLSIPLLAAPGKPVGRGALRFLTFQTLAVPFILFSGWLLAGSEVSAGDPGQVLRAAILLAIGFCFLLAVFPFHTWIPMLAEEAHPYATTFVFYILPGFGALFALSFLERYPWLRNSETTYTLLLSMGAVMMFTGGLWAAFQRHLGRLLGYAVLVDTGLSLLALGVSRGALISTLPGSQGVLPPLILFLAIFLARGLALAVWALALSAIHDHTPDLSFRAVQGLGRKLPIASASLVLAHFSLAGFPLLASFPVRVALFENLFFTHPYIGLWGLAGSAGLMIGGMRTLAVLVMGKEETPWQIAENRTQIFFLLVALMLLLVAGSIPPTLR